MPNTLLKRPSDSVSYLLLESKLLFERGYFEECRRTLNFLLEEKSEELLDSELSQVLHRKACLLDREDKPLEADKLFLQAEHFDPVNSPAPPRFELSYFESAMDLTLASLPSVYQPYLGGVQFTIKDYPGDESNHHEILGLYVGTPRPKRSFYERDDSDQVFIYKRNHEIQIPKDLLFHEVKKTVAKEVGHHFGLNDNEMSYYL